MKRHLASSILFLQILLTSAAALAGILPFWLDSASRGNTHDPALRPGNGKTQPTPKPTPFRGVKVYVEQGATDSPVPNARVMLGNDAAGAQATNASGLAYFPSATLPVDVHAFSPLSGGVPTLYPAIQSYISCTAQTVHMNLFFQNQGSSTMIYNFFYNITDTSAPGNMFSSNVCSPSYNCGSGGGVGECYVAPGNTFYLCAIEQNPDYSIASALFYPPTKLMAPMTITASTGTTGYSLKTVVFTESGAAPVNYIDYQINLGSDQNRHWNLPIHPDSTIPTAQPCTLPIPNGYNYWEVDFSAQISSTPPDYMDTWGWQQGMGIPSSVAFNATGPVQIIQAPSQANPQWVIQNGFGSNADSWQAHINASSLTWRLIGLGPAAGNNLSFSLPTAFPAGYPSGLNLAAGTAYYAGTDFYVQVPSAPMDPSHVSGIFPNAPFMSSQDSNTFTW